MHPILQQILRELANRLADPQLTNTFASALHTLFTQVWRRLGGPRPITADGSVVDQFDFIYDEIEVYKTDIDRTLDVLRQVQTLFKDRGATAGAVESARRLIVGLGPLRVEYEVIKRNPVKLIGADMTPGEKIVKALRDGLVKLGSMSDSQKTESLVESEARRALENIRAFQAWMNRLDDRVVVLLFGAGPLDCDKLRIEREFDEVEKAISTSNYRDFVLVKRVGATSREILMDEIETKRPEVVHLSAHGTRSRQLVLEDTEGRSYPVFDDNFLKMFKVYSQHVRLIILNACRTAEWGDRLAAHIEYVIAMQDDISDVGARLFSRRFYHAFAENYDVNASFDLACADLGTEPTTGHEEKMPVLFLRDRDEAKGPQKEARPDNM